MSMPSADKSLRYSLMAMTKPELTAEEKFLLLRTLHLYGSAVVNRPLVGLEQLYGLSDGVLQKTRDSLIEKKWLTPEVGTPNASSSEKHAGGRPPKAFRVSEHRLYQLQLGVDVKEEAGRQDGIQGEKVKGIAEWQQQIKRLQTSPHQDSMDDFLFWGEAGGQGRDLLAVIRKDEGGGEKRDEGDGKKKGRPPLPAPRYTTRLLLGILLGLADKGGVVRGISLGGLACMTGTSLTNIKYQLGVLAEAGYLRSYVPGITGKFAYGRVTGAFFLNLAAMPVPRPEILVCCHEAYPLANHPFCMGGVIYQDARNRFRNGHPPRMHIDPSRPFSDLDGDPAWREQLLERIRQELAEKLRPAGRQAPDIESSETGFMLSKSRELWDAYGLHWVFRDGGLALSAGFVRHVQAKIEEYASELLSNHWERIGKKGLWPKELLARIRKDILPSAQLRRFQAIAACPNQLDKAAAYYIYILALRMAYWLKALLMHDLPAQDWQGMEQTRAQITILPAVDVRFGGVVRVAISITPKNTEMKIQAKVIGVTRMIDQQLLPAIIKSEEELINESPYWLQPKGIKEGLKRQKNQEIG